MAAKPAPALDLFGNPWAAPKDPRGRKSHRYSAEVAENIAILRATGSTIEECAAACGLSVPTLNKYYFRALDKGATVIRQVLMLSAYRKAKTGQTGAVRFIFDKLDEGGAAVPLAKRPGARAKAEPPIGKKAEADLAAQTAHEGSEWATLLRH